MAAKRYLDYIGRPYKEIVVGKDVTIEELRQMFPDVIPDPLIIVDGRRVRNVRVIG